MKLVDLDEIEYFTLVDKFGVPRYKIEIGDGLPIVKAITIEWIDHYIKRKVKIDGITEEVLYINDMLKSWEEENGKE